MAWTPSLMLELGTILPEFQLPEPATNEIWESNKVKIEKALVVMIICNHCPAVLNINKKLVNVVEEYKKQGVEFVAFSSNDAQKYPQDSPEMMVIHAKENNYNFPYLYDESQDVAKAFKGACTPEFYVFNSDRKLVYRGQFDDSRPNGTIPVTGKDLTDALDAILNNREINPNQNPSVGCNIKWKD